MVKLINKKKSIDVVDSLCSSLKKTSILTLMVYTIGILQQFQKVPIKVWRFNFTVCFRVWQWLNITKVHTLHWSCNIQTLRNIYI